MSFLVKFAVGLGLAVAALGFAAERQDQPAGGFLTGVGVGLSLGALWVWADARRWARG